MLRLLRSLAILAVCADARGAAVLRLEAKGAVTPAMSRYLTDGLASASEAGASAVLIELDTPGGLLDSTREIVQAILAADAPVIVHVAPSGARATSAGVFILMASDVAAMSPGSHLGAAHPVALGGPQASTGAVTSEKAVSDAAAYVRGLAADKGRNPAWAERAVRESASLTSAEALRRGVVELLEADRGRLLERLHGRRIVKKGRAMRLDTAGAEVRDLKMSLALRVLHVIANPNVALLLLMIGIYGLIYEFASPGVGFGAVVGLTSLILAGYALSALPVNYAGLLLIALGLVLLAVELQVPSYGLLTAGGLALLVLGSLFLYDSKEAYLRVSLEMIAGVTVATGAFFTLVVAKLLRTRGLPPAVGAETLVGLVAEARETLGPRGLVWLNGELWTAEAARTVEKGARVRVIGVKGSTLRVKPLEEDSHG